nr:unnamed protein product [Digitaria exilis]
MNGGVERTGDTKQGGVGFGSLEELPKQCQLQFGGLFTRYAAPGNCLLMAASGVRFYQMRNPTGSPLTRILQVILAALRKRHSIIHDSVALQEIGEAVCLDGEDNLYTKRKEFLDKACIYAGDTSPWSFCSTTQLDETKVFLRMLPIFISSLLIFMPFTLLMTLTIQVGRTMDRRIGTFEISSASLIAIPIALHMFLQPVSSRFITPFLRRMTVRTALPIFTSISFRPIYIHPSKHERHAGGAVVICAALLSKHFVIQLSGFLLAPALHEKREQIIAVPRLPNKETSARARVRWAREKLAAARQALESGYGMSTARDRDQAFDGGAGCEKDTRERGSEGQSDRRVRVATRGRGVVWVRCGRRRGAGAPCV